jgi:hypothetical protein
METYAHYIRIQKGNKEIDNHYKIYRKTLIVCLLLAFSTVTK